MICPIIAYMLNTSNASNQKISSEKSIKYVHLIQQIFHNISIQFDTNSVLYFIRHILATPTYRIWQH